MLSQVESSMKDLEFMSVCEVWSAGRGGGQDQENADADPDPRDELEHVSALLLPRTSRMFRRQHVQRCCDVVWAPMGWARGAGGHPAIVRGRSWAPMTSKKAWSIASGANGAVARIASRRPAEALNVSRISSAHEATASILAICTSCVRSLLIIKPGRKYAAQPDSNVGTGHPVSSHAATPAAAGKAKRRRLSVGRGGQGRARLGRGRSSLSGARPSPSRPRPGRRRP